MFKLISSYLATTFIGGCIVGYYHGKSKYVDKKDTEKIFFEAVVTACFAPVIVPIHMQNYLNNPEKYTHKKCPYIQEIK